MIGRQTLRIVIVLGVLLTLVGGTGIFAVFSDRATTGPNTVTSGAQPNAAHLQLNVGIDNGQAIDCETDPDANGVTFEDDLTTGLFTLQDMQPGTASDPAYLCLRNAGSAPLSLYAAAIDLVDADIDCTGDEAAAGDTTCGLDPNLPAGQEVPQAGELSHNLSVTIDEMHCHDSTVIFSTIKRALYNLTDPAPTGFTRASIGAGTLDSGAELCLQLTIAYPSDTATTAVQLAQTDRATWRFAFDGVAQ
jgi:predicted ribosomally synthesized peptide with SipW-like signal peptide